MKWQNLEAQTTCNRNRFIAAELQMHDRCRVPSSGYPALDTATTNHGRPCWLRAGRRCSFQNGWRTSHGGDVAWPYEGTGGFEEVWMRRWRLLESWTLGQDASDACLAAPGAVETLLGGKSGLSGGFYPWIRALGRAGRGFLLRRLTAASLSEAWRHLAAPKN